MRRPTHPGIHPVTCFHPPRSSCHTGQAPEANVPQLVHWCRCAAGARNARRTLLAFISIQCLQHPVPPASRNSASASAARKVRTGELATAVAVHCKCVAPSYEGQLASMCLRRRVARCVTRPERNR